MAELAKSIFARTPDEATVVADVYKKLDDTTLNSFQDFSVTGLDLQNQFGFLSKSTAGNLLKSASDNSLTLNTESLTDKVSSAFSDEYSKAKSLVSGLMDGSISISATLKSTTNSVTGLLRKASDVYYTVNGVVSAVKNGNTKDLRGIVNTLNAVAGRTSVLLSANGALGGIMTGLVGEAGSLGIQDSFGIVAAGIRDAGNITNTSQMMYQVASGSLPGAISRGDLRSVASMVDQLGTGSVSMMNPSVVKLISKNNTASYSAADIGGDAGQFVQYSGAYQKMDPTWNSSSWAPVTSDGSAPAPIKDLSCLMGASPGTQDVFITGAKLSANPDDKYYSALSAFGAPKTVDSELAARYPANPGITVTNIYNPDVDPRLYATTIE